MEEVGPNKYDENEERVVIADANALIDPLAVMVLPIHAFVADKAVSRIPWSHDSACWTNVQGPEELVQLQE